MVNLKHKLTVDDLIVEYMICKVKNGYEPRFTTGEFVKFLMYFETKMPVYDSLYDGDELFKRFFERKNQSDWSVIKNWITMEKEENPHMNISYDSNKRSQVIEANYKLSNYDRSFLNTYFMDEGMSKYEDFKGEAFKIREIIKEYLSTLPKRNINYSKKIKEKDLIIGEYVACHIVENIWQNYIEDLQQKDKWPRDFNDINKYLLETDLAEIIGVKSIKDLVVKLYEVFSRRVALLYQEDKDLKISTNPTCYLARANYDLLIEGYEEIMNKVFGVYKRNIDVDLSTSTYKESHEIEGFYICDEGPAFKTTINKFGSQYEKKLVLSLNKNIL